MSHPPYYHHPASICFQKFGNLIVSFPFLKSFTLRMNCSFLLSKEAAVHPKCERLRMNCSFLAQQETGLCLLSASFFFVLLVQLYAAVKLGVASPKGTHSSFFRALSLLFSLPSNLDQSLRKFRGRSSSRKLFLITTATPAPFPGPFPST